MGEALECLRDCHTCDKFQSPQRWAQKADHLPRLRRCSGIEI